MEMLFKVLDDMLGIKEILGDINIKNVVMDSRQAEKNSVFFAINNGNSYIDSVLEKGASLVIADNYSGSDKRVVKVKDTVRIMQDIAREYRKRLDIKIIAITGSNGKTTTKDMIYSILSEKYNTAKTMGNYNNHIGLPYTILQLDEKIYAAVLEMGMSGFGEIDLLADIAQPDIGVITNIGDSHLEFLKTRENVFKAKTELVKYVSVENLYVDGDDFYLKNLTGNKIGFGKNNNFRIENFSDDEDGMSFTLNGEELKIPLNGKHNALNAGMAAAVGKSFGLSHKETARGLENLNLTPMRFQKIEKENIVYINDAYNASPVSMECSLDTFDKLYNDRVKIAVLGDMLELGEKEIEYHKNVIKKALSIHTDKIYLYGERMAEAVKSMNSDKISCFSDKKMIAEAVSKEEKAAVLLKGSRGMRLEEII